MKSVSKRNLTIGLSLVLLIALSASVYFYANSHHRNCDQILSEFNEESKTNPLNELDPETAKCMNAF